MDNSKPLLIPEVKKTFEKLLKRKRKRLNKPHYVWVAHMDLVSKLIEAKYDVSDLGRILTYLIKNDFIEISAGAFVVEYRLLNV